MKLKLFVPGRLCLFGEHTDWAGKYRTMNANVEPGLAIVTGLEQGIEAEVWRSRYFEVTSEAPEIAYLWKDFTSPMNENDLKNTAKSDSFFSYCAGVASYMLEWYKVGGVHIHIKSMTLPIKSGLSSSAAICVLVARAFNRLYGLNLNTLGEMNIAYLGEQRTKSRCGRLDQACAFGVKPNLMTFDGDEIEVQTLNNKAPLHWVFADLCAAKDTITILRDLNKAYPFASNAKEEELHQALGQQNRQIIERAVAYMRQGEVEKLGQLMTEAQKLFDEKVAPMCPSQLTSPKLHSVLADENIQPLVYGGKGVGSQGDGSIQFLAKDADCQERLYTYLAELGMRPYKLTIKPIHSIRKAIIPVAGFGTRLYPSTRILKKDFFPIVDSDGRVKPVILILLEELVQSGIEEICIVVGSEEERQQYRNFFENHLPDQHMRKLNPQSREYEERILNIGKRLQFIIQEEKRGFGHAVWQCAEFADNKPVLLLLGDTLYKTFTNKPCAQQLIELYEKYNRPMISIHEVPLNMVSRYGIVTGQWEDSDESVMRMSRIHEKPTNFYAEMHLGVKDHIGTARYYSVFGQYILTKEVFEQLEQDVENAQPGVEIELTSALEAVRERMGMMAVRLNGKMYDMGNAEAYRKAVAEFGLCE